MECEPLREQHVLTQYNFDEHSLTCVFFHLWQKSLFPEVLRVIELLTKWDESVICTAAIQIYLDNKEHTAISQNFLLTLLI